jgi:hypothetical protein
MNVREEEGKKMEVNTDLCVNRAKGVYFSANFVLFFFFKALTLKHLSQPPPDPRTFIYCWNLVTGNENGVLTFRGSVK